MRERFEIPVAAVALGATVIKALHAGQESRLDSANFFRLTVAATGTRPLDAFGHTADGFTPAETPIMEHAPEISAEVSQIVGTALRRFAVRSSCGGKTGNFATTHGRRSLRRSTDIMTGYGNMNIWKVS